MNKKRIRLKTGLLSIIFLCLSNGACLFCADETPKRTPEKKSAPVSQKQTPTPVVHHLGSEFEMSGVVPLETVILAIDKFNNQEVVVSGVVSEVNEKGTWMHLTSKEKTASVFSPSEWSFPKEAKGMKSIVKGIISRRVLSGEELESFFSEHSSVLKKEDYPNGSVMFSIAAVAAEIQY